jgi:HSP20 family protein
VEKEESGKRFHRSERSYGAFTRTFSLPETADSSRIRAEFKNGLLKVHLPKSEKAQPKEIQVAVE